MLGDAVACQIQERQVTFFGYYPDILTMILKPNIQYTLHTIHYKLYIAHEKMLLATVHKGSGTPIAPKIVLLILLFIAAQKKAL